jgi:hypothetical protein
METDISTTFADTLVKTGSFSDAVKATWTTMKTDIEATMANLLSDFISQFVDQVLEQLGLVLAKAIAIDVAEALFFDSGGIVPQPGGVPQYFAAGGPVQYFDGGGRARGTDTVPAMLTPGEMVLTRGQQQSIFGGNETMAAVHTELKGLRRDLASLPIMLRHAMRGQG